MGWGAQQWLRCTKESAYGEFDDEATGGDVAWFRLASDDAFGMRVVPQRQIIRSADGGNRRRQQVAARKVVAGSLATLWYPSQSKFLLDAALDLDNNDLPSYTLDYFDTMQVHRFLGCKVQSLELPGDAQGDWIPAQVGWVAQKRESTAVTLDKPLDSMFPSDLPYEHYESKGGLSIGGVISKYSSLGISINNTLAPTWDEDQWVSALYYAGRDIDLSLRLQYLSTAMRTAFEAQTALTVSAEWTRAAGLKSKFELKSKNYIADVADNLPLGNAAYQTINIQSFYDGSASTDVSYSVS